ncbi:MAG: ATP-dependent DNA helicase RecG [Clostridia bacterium]|nr:ATP-dependent DNA helicase RecG [Clostridia bacterium]
MKGQPDASSSVRVLRGVGETRAKTLEKAGIVTVLDVVRHFPRAYQDRGDVRRLSDGRDGQKHSFHLTVATTPSTARLRSRMTLTKFRVFDETGSAEAVFFNQPYLREVFHVGDVFRFYGSLSFSKNKCQLSSPAYEPAEEGAALPDYFPVYSLPDGVSQKVFRGMVEAALPIVLPTLSDPLPEPVRLENRLPALSLATRTLHAPESGEELQAALRRMVFDELLLLGLGVSLSRCQGEAILTRACKKTTLAPLLAELPYELTGAQKRAINEIYADMTGYGKNAGMVPAMRRILIGDVGCGKTVCAAAAIYIALQSGRQAALMVPTTILAEQHYRELSPLFAKLGFEVGLLTSGTKAAEKKRLIARLADPVSPLPLVIGTHALLSDDVVFADLALTVTDEQHRFGVMQRTALKEKSAASHTLVMSATPIPRTLAHVLYGDLSLSKIDEMPKGRQRVDTFVVDETYRARLYDFIRRQVSDGGQVYIVCPSIEEKKTEDEEDGIPLEELDFTRAVRSSSPPLKDATGYAKELSEKVFPDLSVALLHGRMKQADKDAVMERFVSGEIKILVSTTVIEVGVNVPTATLMIVENAERFGLSQLHQLRGRVGRGQKKSYCILVSDRPGEVAEARLDVMHTTYDGYEIAERDLSLRGPGDFFASGSGEMRQSGGLSLKLAALCRDTALMEAAFRAADSITRDDPDLSKPEHAPLKKEVERMMTINQNTVS